jgi:hypothetical protein
MSSQSLPGHGHPPLAQETALLGSLKATDNASDEALAPRTPSQARIPDYNKVLPKPTIPAPGNPITFVDPCLDGL